MKILIALLLFVCGICSAQQENINIDGNQSKLKQYIGISSNGKDPLSNKKHIIGSHETKGSYYGILLTDLADAMGVYLQGTGVISGGGGYFSSSSATESTAQDQNNQDYSIDNVGNITWNSYHYILGDAHYSAQMSFNDSGFHTSAFDSGGNYSQLELTNGEVHLTTNDKMQISATDLTQDNSAELNYFIVSDNHGFVRNSSIGNDDNAENLLAIDDSGHTVTVSKSTISGSLGYDVTTGYVFFHGATDPTLKILSTTIDTSTNSITLAKVIDGIYEIDSNGNSVFGSDISKLWISWSPNLNYNRNWDYTTTSLPASVFFNCQNESGSPTGP